MKSITPWLVALASAFALIACGDGEDDKNNPPAGGASVTGLVVDMDSDAPVPNARISAGGRSVLSQADGRFTLTGLAASERLPVQVEATGHGHNVAIVKLPANSAATLRVRLLKLAPAQVFNAETGATLTLPGTTAQAQVPANSLIDALTGTPVVGPVTASVTNVDPARDPERMPGGYTTLENGNVVRAIESFGAIKVDLRDANGRRLQLAPNTDARIRIPLSTRSPNPPADVPLFHFDEATGRWTKEGIAMLRTAPNGERYYQGDVTHYSYWNADIESETVEVEGCVQNPDGSPAAGVIVSGSGSDYSGRTSAITNNEGRFTMSVRKNAITSIWAATDARVTPITELTVGENGGGIAGDCLRLEASTSPVPGRLSPRIMQNPRNTTVDAGQPALLQAVAEGTQPITYRWSRNGQPIANSNTSVLWVFNTTAADDGSTFTVTATNAAGAITSSAARLNVTSTPIAPSIGTQPLSVTAVAGETASFAVVAQGSGPLAYHWLRNGAPIAGATQAVYQFTASQGDNAALFSVRVSNAVDSVTSQAATLTVVSAQSAPVITTQPSSVVASVGGSASFAVAATGSGPIGYQWQRNGTNIAAATEASYTLNAVSAADNGAQFRVIVSNGQGEVASNAATLTVSVGSEDQQAQVLKLMSLWSDGLSAAGAPLQFVEDDFRVKAINQICLGGNATLTLDGGAAPPVGQSLPLGQHTLAAQFAACTGEFGIGYAGLSSAAYSFTDPAHRVGTVQSTITHFVNSDVDDNGDPVSTRVSGAARVEVDGSLNGNVDTQRLRFIPTAGLLLTDMANGTASTFSSGNVLVHTVTVDTTAGPRPQLSRQEYTQLSFTRGGVAYVSHGFVQFDFDELGRLSSGSGVVEITANGQLMARVRATAGGFAVEVVTAPPGFSPSAIKRARVGAAKPAAPAKTRHFF
ncbi:MAG: immunoglobulin domain-containing protein [Rhizobacter sp.]|nr:immunoglobulin domain-containing protein [Rhizobacter sp.]